MEKLKIPLKDVSKRTVELLKPTPDTDKITIDMEYNGNVSDGYHTFNELYEHRITLLIALCKQLDAHCNDYESPVWMSKLHFDGSKFDGWFIMGINEKKGEQITYHLPMSKWEECKKIRTIRELKKAPEFDGHSPADVLERLRRL